MKKRMLRGLTFTLAVITVLIYGAFYILCSRIYNGQSLTGKQVLEQNTLIFTLLSLLFILFVSICLLAAKKISSSFETEKSLLSAAKIPVGFCIVKLDSEFTLTYANQTFYDIYGYTSEQFLEENNNHIFTCTYPDDFEKTKEQINLALKESQSNFELEQRIVRRDGSVEWVMVRGSFEFNIESDPIICCVIIDITKEKMAEQNLKTNVEHLQIALAQTDNIIFNYYPQTDVLKNTGKFSYKFGIPREIFNFLDRINQNKLLHKDDIKVITEHFHKIRQGEPCVAFMFRASSPQGGISWFDTKMTNVFDLDGKPVLSVGIVKEITHLKILEADSQYKKAMISDSIFTFEANITQDKLVGDFSNSTLMNLDGSYTKMIEEASRNIIHKDDVPMFLRHFAPENIRKEFYNGKNLLHIEYRRLSEDNKMMWVLNTANIIQDKITNEISIFCFIKNIDAQKKCEISFLEGKKFHAAMLADAIGFYEVDLTNNELISGQEYFQNVFGIENIDSYSQLIDKVVGEGVFEEDVEIYKAFFLLENILASYKQNKTDISLDYRTINQKKIVSWVSCTMHIIKDSYSGNIKGFCYIKDITNKKLKELSLEYRAQRDDLTGMYNKSVTESMINEYLSSEKSKDKIHALIMIDIDDFKNINDTLGHIFGDWAILDISNKIKSLFKSEGIVGRVGGDEFVIFVKDIGGLEMLDTICRNLSNVVNCTYVYDQKKCHVTGSFGIALSPEHGTTFRELYIKSDRALYGSKGEGKNRYTVYGQAME